MSKFKTRDLPTLLAYYNRKQELPRKLVFFLAALISFYKGKREEEEIKLSDNQDIVDLYKEQWGRFNGTLESTNAIVTNVLGYEENWEMDLNKIPGLTAAVTIDLFEIETKGMKQAIEAVLEQKTVK